MKLSNFRILLVFSITAIFIQSCSYDNEEIDSETLDTETIDDLNKGPNESDTTIDLITDWNSLWVELDQYAFGMRPNATARALAYIHLAAYETAVHDMRGYRSIENRLDGLQINDRERDRNISLDLALNTCYAIVMDHFMNNIDPSIDNKIGLLQSEYEDQLSQRLRRRDIRNSIEWGTHVAEQVIAYSQTDTEAETQILEPQPLDYEPPVGPGLWSYSAEPERGLFPYWGKVRTFVISSEETTSIPPPLNYSTDPNSDYFAEMNEVYTVSTRATEENNEELWIAEFWSDDVEGLMVSPPGRQIAIANQLIEKYDLDYDRSLAMLLKLGFSLNDAAVSSWADKYEYLVMRPSVYIQEFINPDYQTNLFKFIFWPNPTFPGYPSGHSTFASAAAGIFIDEFGNDTNFTDRTHEGRTEFLGQPRQFDSFTEMAEENAFSRIPLGVHIRIDCTEGYRLGYEISDAVNRYRLRN
ncbi:vanadium-dependent haloperoxidase [Aquimarina sp. MMG015]|uniref:vanadium-dependent haloperoxidase n=1 Tax=Aquimarina sp. MMG015 TaxID=2822689 RepID=UPI001B3A3606|nr:vanadium-dependent haloperoxidase [Aquimarina sp. MMG015]MBQ4805590.1 vanadium-dependent haloperoxidase [Aquimarina sp. MMG015]